MSIRKHSWLLLLALASQIAAQIPRIGIIESYGYEKLNPDRLARLAGVRIGDPLPPSKTEIEQKLEASNDVVRAHVEGYCCQGDNVVLYLGVLESGAGLSRCTRRQRKTCNFP